MHIRIFYKIVDSLDTPKNIGAVSENQDIKKELARLKWELDQEKNEIKKRDLQRRIMRLERFDILRESSGRDKKASNVKKILGWKTTEDYLWSDLLSLKRQGIDIVPLVLVSDTKIDAEISSSGMKGGDIFTVNFGGNKYLGAHIGAGDILSAEVSRVRINGKEWTRKNSPRPWYYDEKGKYLPVFDGYKIEILSLWTLDENDTKQASEATEKRWRKLRASDMFDYNDKNPLTDLTDDKSLFSDVTEIAKERAQMHFYKSTGRVDFMNTFWEIVSKESRKYWIPESILVDNLFANENRAFNPQAKNPYSSAHGLGQIIDKTWGFIARDLMKEQLNRDDPIDQIRATCAYLNYIKNLKNCSWWDAVVYYHTWPGFNDSHVQWAMAVNAPIVARMKNIDNPTAQDYIDWAKRYYWISETA